MYRNFKFMRPVELTLYNLLKISLEQDFTEKIPTDVDWKDVFKIAQMQGVAAIAMDGLQKLFLQCNYKPELDVKTKIKWYAVSIAIKNGYERQLLSAKELSKIWHIHKIRTLLLKGFAFADYYPKPSLRPASDMDCYLCGKYEEGNHVVEDIGIHVDREDYRHSTFRFGNVFVENHKICTTVRGWKQRKCFEVYLRSLLEKEETLTLTSSYLEKPCDKFNALFFLQHSHRHFLREGITLRYICDWAMIIKNTRCFDNDFWNVCKANELKSFAESMTRLAYVVCGVKVSWLHMTRLQKQDILLLKDCYSIGKNAIKYGNKMRAHIQIAKNMLKSYWKYKYFSSHSLFVELGMSVWANRFEKEPQIL